MRGIRKWADDVETKINEAKSKMERVKRVLLEIENKETIRKREEDEFSFRKAIDVETKKQLAIGNGKLKLERVQRKTKLAISKFSGTFTEWLPFWNMFELEIGSANLLAVSKFVYLKELLESKVLVYL